MYNNYDYPVGSDTRDAPWNQIDNPEIEVEVTVSLTLSKSMKIKISDYKIISSEIDEDGVYSKEIDFSDCDLKSAVIEQITLPQEAYNFVYTDAEEDRIIKSDLKDWVVDDFEVVLEC